MPRSRHVTIMLVPHFGERTYQVRLPVSFFRRLLASAVLICAILFGFLQSYSIMRGNMDELARLRQETDAQRSLLDSLSGQAAAMQERETRIASLEQQVRALIEDDAFLPAHLKAQLLAALRQSPRQPPGDAASLSPARELYGEGLVGGSKGGGSPLLPAPPLEPQPSRRAGPLASRAMSRLWGTAGANSPAGEGASGAGGAGGGTNVPTTAEAVGQAITGDLAQAVSSGQIASDRLAALREVLQQRQDILLSLPQCMPVLGRFTSGFGYRRSPFGLGREFHAGVDLAAPKGTPVRAVADGVVVFAGYKVGLGRTVILDHGHGIRTVYGHHSRLLVQAGQQVEAGQIIAAVGESGRATGDHLHFELHFNGREVDPWPYLQRLGGEK
ncbi:MAG: M23 family metallopeptidase [Bacillota bacterium]